MPVTDPRIGTIADSAPEKEHASAYVQSLLVILNNETNSHPSRKRTTARLAKFVHEAVQPRRVPQMTTAPERCHRTGMRTRK